MDIGKPHKIMTKREYERSGYESPHIVHWNYDGAGNVGWWPLEPILLAAADRDSSLLNPTTPQEKD